MFAYNFLLNSFTVLAFLTYWSKKFQVRIAPGMNEQRYVQALQGHFGF